MSVDYSIFYRRAIATDRIALELQPFDIFISSFNSSSRLGSVFAEVPASRKIWLVHPEYQYAPLDLPIGNEIVTPTSTDEVAQVDALLRVVGSLRGKTLCIDITGFMRHVLAFLVAKLAYDGIKEFTAVYSEPMSYVKQEATTFSTRTPGIVRPVRGMAGSNHINASDFLILTVGFDHKLISEITNHKDSVVIYPVLGFPSLSPDMYQQSAIRAAASGGPALEESWITNRRFAPANDPFSTAHVVSEVVKEIDRRNAYANIYLSPLATKAQALGLALYWQLEGKKRGAVTMLLPECSVYARETSLGLKRLWAYTVELDV